MIKITMRNGKTSIWPDGSYDRYEAVREGPYDMFVVKRGERRKGVYSVADIVSVEFSEEDEDTGQRA